MDSRFIVRHPNQIKAMIHPLRKNILKQLAQGAQTPSEVGRALDVAASKIHYHVRILEKAGLIKLVETRQVGSVKELYFEPIASEIMIYPESPDEDSLDLLDRDFRQSVMALLRDLTLNRTPDAQGTKTLFPSLLTNLVVTANEGGQNVIEESLALFQQQMTRAMQDDAGHEYRFVLGFARVSDESKELKK